MQIDWFTVVAEIINFLILVALLKYFLYDRVIDVADQREEKVTSRFQEAKQKAEEAEKKAETYRSKRQELEEEREELITQAKKEAKAQKEEMLAEARTEIKEREAHWYDTMQQEKDSFLQELRQRTGQQTYTVARKALADLANADLQQQIIEVFIERIKNLDPERQKAMAESIQNSDHKLVISSTFEIPQQNRQKLLVILSDQFNRNLEGEFKRSSDLICGIELKINGHKVAWSLENYLDALQENLGRVLEQELTHKHPQKKAETDES